MNATLTNDALNRGVSWSISNFRNAAGFWNPSTCGSIDANGLFAAATAGYTVVIRASSIADSNRFADIEIGIVQP